MNSNQYPQLLNVPVVHGEITVVYSTHAEASMKHSARLAAKSSSLGLNTLIVNCGMSHKRYHSHFSKQYEERYKKPRLILKSYVSGDMLDNTEEIGEICDHHKIGLMVLCGWEFVASDYRRRNRLIDFLRELMKQMGVAIVIYAHNARNPVAGRMDYGGIGKLSLLAIATQKLDTTVYFEETEPSTDPHVTSEEEQFNMNVWGVHHSAKNINNLQAEVGEIENSELRIEKGEGVVSKQ